MASYSLHSFTWRIHGSRKLLLLAVLCLGLALVGAPSASAHDELVSSTPDANERFATTPSSVALRFSAPLLKIGHEIRVVDAGLKNWVQGMSVLDRETLTQPLAADLPAGEYQVRWRVVSSDGHPINGSYSFLVGADAQPGSVPAPSAGTVAPQAKADSATQPSPDTPASDGTPATLPGWLPAAGIGAIGGVALYLLWAVVVGVRKAATRRD